MTTRYLITIGDSLSDRATFDGRYLLGLYPIKKLNGLLDKSPHGRFTNGFVWSDYLSSMLANEMLIRELKAKRHLDSTDIADAVINQSLAKEDASRYGYSLKNDQFVNFHGRNILRSYNEAGLTAHDYHWTPSTKIGLSLRRNIVSTLTIMREKLLAYDKEHSISAEQKAQTRILDWSGANDLLIANEKPSEEIVEKAIQARIENIEILIRHGYRQFTLFNLPDLFITPRYQKRSPEDRNNAHKCSLYFNLKLKEACLKLAERHPNCLIEEYDVNQIFTDGYEHPEKFGLDADKTKIPYIKSKEFKAAKPKGFTFWDDVHFTAFIHYMLGERLYKKLSKDFDFTPRKQWEEKLESKPSESNAVSKSKLLVGAIGTAATLIGLSKFGVSKTMAALGIGLATLGVFAPKPRVSLNVPETNLKSLELGV